MRTATLSCGNTKGDSMARATIPVLETVHLGLVYVLQNCVSKHYLAGSSYYPWCTPHMMGAKTWDTQRSIKTFMSQYESMLKPDQTICVYTPSMHGKQIPRDSIEKFDILCLDYTGKVVHKVGTGELRSNLIKLPT